MRYLVSITILLFSIAVSGQKSDYLLLKKRNNRTVKTYFTGTFISAVTHGGFELNGKIKDIRHDTLFVEQQDVRQVPTQFGVYALDTLVYTIGIDYRDIRKFNYAVHTGFEGAPRRKGFAEVALPRVMTIGGLGYIVLETVNTLYRKESFNQKGKLGGMAIAAGIAGAGLLIKSLQDRKREAGGKFQVVYVRMN